MTMADLGTAFFSETDVPSGGTFRWMSPELLYQSRYGTNSRPTPESDCYALGMVIYEASRSHSSRWSLVNRPPGSYWPPTVLPSVRLLTRARCSER